MTTYPLFVAHYSVASIKKKNVTWEILTGVRKKKEGNKN